MLFIKNFQRKFSESRIMLAFIVSVLFLSLGFHLNAAADGTQTKTITGKVVSAADNQPIIGATVTIVGTTKGVATDVDGNFSLEASPSDVIRVSFIGFKPQEITVGAQTIIKVQLEVETFGLDEVVKVGYGTMKKSDISGASVTVSAKDITNVVGANIDNLLQGKASGVQITSTSGQPGAGMKVNIRGTGTLDPNAQPLYIIDGVPVQNTSQGGHDVGLGDALGNGNVSTFSGLSSINPEDIENVEILKDASASAIYGSRAANGVVLITTKKGRKGEASFNYKGSYGIQEQAKRLDIMNLREYAQYSVDIASETEGREGRVEFLDPSILGEGTNWQDAIFQIAPMQQHQLSASGGYENVDFYISGSYYDQEGTVLGSQFERETARVNLNADLKPWLKVGTNTSIAFSKDNLGLTNSQDGLISQALLSSPDVPIYNTDGTFSGDQREGSPGRINPIGKALDETNKLKRMDLTANFYTEISFIPELKLRSELAINKLNTNSYHFEPTFTYGNISSTVNSISKQYSQNSYYEIKNYLTYTNTFGKHSITAMLGQEVSEWEYEHLRGAASDLSSNDIQNVQLGSNYSIGSGFGSGSRVSVFGRAYYGYSDKYNLTYTYRRDGSSNFGPEKRWAPFHAMSTSWRIINENFMETTKSYLSNLKLRVGWGQVGNDNIGGYLWGASGNNIETDLGAGYQQTNLANPYVSWETQETWNFGLDLGFFDNRLNAVLEYYMKNSKDMLMVMQLPSYMGTSGNPSARLNAPTGNFGEISNKGFELSIDAIPVQTADFKWSANLRFSKNKNKLVSLSGSGTQAIYGYGQWTDVVTRTVIGEPLFNFYGYKVIGIYQDYNDLLDNARPGDEEISRSGGVWIGDLKYADLSGPDGIPDGIINEYDKTTIGTPHPDFTFGFSNTFSYKRFDLSIFLTGSYGNDLLNYLAKDLTAMSSLWDNQVSDVADRAKLAPIDASITYPRTVDGNVINNWYDDATNIHVSNPGADLPRAIVNDPANNRRISDRYIEDGSYIKIKTLSLAYNFPSDILNRISLDGLKVYANVSNLHTFTKYTGLDPEVGVSQTSNYVIGLDNGRYPSPRIVTFGLDIKF